MVGLVALTILGTSLVGLAPTGMASEVAEPTESGAGLELLSYEQYAQQYGAAPDVQAEDPVAMAAELEGSGSNSFTDASDTTFNFAPDEGQKETPWHHILTQNRTWEGKDAPTRRGGSKVAWAKACGKHNVCNFRIFNTAYEGYCKEPSGSRCVYISLVLYNGKIVATVRVIHDSGFSTVYGGTPDGRNVGTITAYCSGVERCPSIVNRA